MPLPVQAKMLRLLQEQTFERVGGNSLIATDVRVIAATNKNLEQSIEAGSFRNDLYYRLKVVTVSVPALRDRADDIPELARHFLGRYGRAMGRDGLAITPDLMARLRAYVWPGNVRELQSVIRQGILNTPGHELGIEAWPSAIIAPPIVEPTEASFGLAERIERMLGDGQPEVYGRIMAEVERELLTRALRRTRGHQAQASELLGINRTTLRTKLRELGIALDKVVSDRPMED